LFYRLYTKLPQSVNNVVYDIWYMVSIFENMLGDDSSRVVDLFEMNMTRDDIDIFYRNVSVVYGNIVFGTLVSA
jgi:hypothetical protein